MPLTIRMKTLWLVMANITGFAVLLWLVVQLQGLLLLVFLAFILSSALLPIVRKLIGLKLPNGAAVLLTFLVMAGLLVGLVLPVGVQVIRQIQQFIQHVPDYWHTLQTEGYRVSDWFDSLERTARQALGQVLPGVATPSLPLLDTQQWLGKTAPLTGQLTRQLWAGLTQATLTLSHLVADGLTVCILSIIMLLERQTIVRFLRSFLPQAQQVCGETLIHRLSEGVGGYVNSQLLLMLIDGVLCTIGLTLLGFPFPLLFGVLSALGLPLPLVGQPVVTAIALVVALLVPGHGDLTGVPLALGVAGLFAVIQLVENNLITPMVLSKTLGLHPLATILAVIAGGILAGVPGVLLAIPVLTCLKVLLSLRRP